MKTSLFSSKIENCFTPTDWIPPFQIPYKRMLSALQNPSFYVKTNFERFLRVSSFRCIVSEFLVNLCVFLAVSSKVFSINVRIWDIFHFYQKFSKKKFVRPAMSILSKIRFFCKIRPVISKKRSQKFENHDQLPIDSGVFGTFFHNDHG